MLTDGFVVIPRRLVTSDFFNDNEKFAILIKLFFEVRFRETNVNGIDIGVNQFICTKADLAERMNINERKLKYILERFQRAGLIKTENIKNKYTLITLLCGEAKVSVKRTENNKHIDERRSTVISAKPDITKKQNEKTHSCEAVEADNLVPDDNAEKKAYGDFSNVFLSEYEYGLLCEKTPLADNYINKFSSYLVNHPEKNYISHFAQLLSHYNSDKISGREEGSEAKGENNENGSKTFIGFSGEPLSPLPNTSYDLIRAMEKIEKSVPVLRKRERR